MTKQTLIERIFGTTPKGSLQEAQVPEASYHLPYQPLGASFIPGILFTTTSYETSNIKEPTKKVETHYTK